MCVFVLTLPEYCMNSETISNTPAGSYTHTHTHSTHPQAHRHTHTCMPSPYCMALTVFILLLSSQLISSPSMALLTHGLGSLSSEVIQLHRWNWQTDRQTERQAVLCPFLLFLPAPPSHPPPPPPLSPLSPPPSLPPPPPPPPSLSLFVSLSLSLSLPRNDWTRRTSRVCFHCVRHRLV